VSAALLLAWTLATTAPGHCEAPSSALPEASGAVVSDLDPGVVFSHDDSGDTARFVAFDYRTCAEVGSWKLALPMPVDWEDAALGPGHTLVFGDIGDNDAVRSSVQLVTVAEPKIGSPYVASPKVTVLRYDDGAHDAEGLLVQPTTGATWVVTKSYAGIAGVYAVRGSRLVKVTSLKLGALQPVTGGSVRRDGGAVVLRTYTDALEWLVPEGSDDLGAALEGTPVARLSLPSEPQGEGVSFTADGTGLVLTSEAQDAKTWPIDVVALPLPASPTPRSTPTPTPTPVGTTQPEALPPAAQPADDTARDVGIGLGAAAFAVAVLAGVVLRRRT
jgi:hypothetical protein